MRVGGRRASRMHSTHQHAPQNWKRILLLAALGTSIVGWTCLSTWIPPQGAQQGALSKARDPCIPQGPLPAASVDWSGFMDPGDVTAGEAAIFSTTLSDLGLLWVVQGVQALGYTVVLYVLPAQEQDLQQLLEQASNTPFNASIAQVQVQYVTLRGTMLHAPSAKVFVHVCTDCTSQWGTWIDGHGKTNFLILPQLVRDSAGTDSSSELNKEQQAQVQDRIDQALASYDHLIYLSTSHYEQHIHSLTSNLQRLQDQQVLHPSIGIVQQPAPPLLLDGSIASTERRMGITFSMSAYDRSKRKHLDFAFEEFARLQRLPGIEPRLVFLPQLLPGIDADIDHLHHLLSQYDLAGMVMQCAVTGCSYKEVAVQWHLYNEDPAVPAFTATAGLPAGVMVLDCSAVMTNSNPPMGISAGMEQLVNLTYEHLSKTAGEQQRLREQIIQGALPYLRKAYNRQLSQVLQRSMRSKVVRYFMQHTLKAYTARLTPDVQMARFRKLQPQQVNQAASLQQRLMQSNSPAAPDRAVPITLSGQHSRHILTRFGLGSSTADGRSTSSPAILPIKAHYAVAIVEARPHYALAYTMLNAAWYLPTWSLHVVHSHINAAFVRHVLHPHLHAQYHELLADDFHVNQEGYRKLLYSCDFWSYFNAEYVLLVDTDSIILKPGLEAFTKYDLVDAAWYQDRQGLSAATVGVASTDSSAGGDTGGFSLRSVSVMLKVCTNQSRHAQAGAEVQDMMDTRQHWQQHGAVVADTKAACSFCLQSQCAGIAGRVPYALHAPWLHANYKVVQGLLEVSLQGLKNSTLC